MATAFNLTAQLNLRGPNNVNKIVADIKKQLSGITANVNMKLDPNVAKNVKALDSSLKSLNATLTRTSSNASDAASALSSLGRAAASVNIKSVPAQLNATVASMNKLNKSSSSVGRALNESATEMQEFGKQAGLAIRRFAAFSAVTGVIYSLTNSINQGIQAYIEYDKELVRLQQVTGKTASGLKTLQQSISQLAVGLGVSSKELTTVSVTLAQAGLSARDTERALKALALSSLAPSFDDMNETVEGSIALMRQFGISAGQLEQALGSINAVAAAFAVEADDLITAIQRTGGVFATASKGVSEGTDALNEFISVFTSVRATTRESAETIATGLRTIFTRIQRGGTIDALKEFGVNLTDTEGKFVGAYKAVQLLSEGLSKLDPRDIKFSRIVEELGGFRQIGKVIPLIQQFSVAQDALKIAQGGQASLAKDAATAQLSLANQIQKVREEFFALFREIGQSKGFQSLVSGVLTLTRGLIKLADVSKSLLPALSVILAFKGASALTQFASGFSKGFRPGGGKPEKDRPRFRDGGPVRYFSAGGDVPGSGSADNVRAMLTPGEFVINKKAASKIGRRTLHKINKYASGGKAIRAGISDIDVTEVTDGDTFTASVTPKTEPFVAQFRLWGYDAYEQGQKRSRITPTKLSQIKKYNTRSGALTEIDESDNPIAIPAYTRVKQGATAQAAAEEGKKTLELKLKNLDKSQMISKINTTLDTEGGFGRYAANLGKLLPDDLTTGRYASKNLGGYIQKFMAGGTAQDVSASEILRVLTLEGARKASGLTAGEINTLLRKKNVAGKDAEAKQAILDAYTTAIGGAEEAINSATKVGLVGLLPIGYSKEFGPEKLGKKNVYMVARGLGSQYSDIVNDMQQESSSLANKYAEQVQHRSIFGGPNDTGVRQKLVFDFDETLVSGADILGPDGKPNISEYSNRVSVERNLENGRLTSLGNKLKELISSDPSFINQTRILTARPQSTVDLLAESLQALGLPYDTSMITGVSSGLGTDIGAEKAKNLAGYERLIDDNLDNVKKAGKSGKSAFLYREIEQLSSSLGMVTGQANIEGAMIEKILASLGAPLKEDAVQNRAIDYPDGLGAAAQYFPGIGANWPTEVKRTIDGSSLFRAREEFARLFTEKFKLGGQVYDLQKNTGLSNGEFDELVKFANTNNFSMDEFRNYLAKRLDQKNSKAGLMMNPASLLRAITPEASRASQSQLELARSLMGSPDAKYNPKYDNAVQQSKKFAGGGSVNLYHGSNTGTNDSVLESFKTQGARSDIAQGYGQGAGLYVYSGKEKAKQQAMMRVNKGLGSFAAVSGDTEGKPMVVSFKESPEPATWDLDYELNKGPIVEWLVKNYDQVKDKLAPTESLTGIKNIVQQDRSQGIMSSGIRVQEGDQTMTSDTGEEMVVKGGARKTIYSGTDSDIREGQLIGQIMGRLQAQDPKMVADFENQFFKSPALISGDWNNLAIKYIGSSPLKPTNIETFANGGVVPALLTPGEAVIPPKMAKKIGYAKLNRMNKADRNGMGRYASGGGVGIVPGSGNGDTFGPVPLPVGSFVIRKKATEALGFNSGGFVQRFAAGGSPNPDISSMIMGWLSSDMIASRKPKMASRPDVVSRATTVASDDTTTALDNLVKALNAVGLSAANSAEMLRKGGDVSYKSIEKALVKDIERLRIAGASIDSIVAAETTLANIRKKSKEDVTKQKSLQGMSNARNTAGVKILGGQTVGGLMSGSGAGQQAIEAQAQSLAEARIKARGGKVTEKQRASIMESSYVDAASRVTGIKKREFKSAGISGGDIQKYISESMKDRKTLAQMDKQLIAIKTNELTNSAAYIAASKAEQQKMLAEVQQATKEEISTRRKIINDLAAQNGEKGVGAAGMFDFKNSPILNQLKDFFKSPGRVFGAASTAAGLVAGSSDMIAKNMYNMSTTEGQGKAARTGAAIQSSGTILSTGLAAASQMAAIPVVGPYVAGLTAVGTAALAAADYFYDFTGSQKAAAQEFERSLRAKEIGESLDGLDREFQNFQKEVTNLDLQSALQKAVGKASAAQIGDNFAERDIAKADFSLKNRTWSDIFTGNFKGSTQMDAPTQNAMDSEMSQKMSMVADRAMALYEQQISQGKSIADIVDEVRNGDRGAVYAGASVAFSANPKLWAEVERQVKASGDASDENRTKIIREIAVRELATNKQLEAAQKAKELSDAMEAANRAGRRLADSFKALSDTIDQAINRVQQESEVRQAQTNSLVEARRGNAKFDPAAVDNRNVGVLTNPRAYRDDPKRLEDAIAAGTSGLSPEAAQKLAGGARLEATLPDILRNSVASQLKENAGLKLDEAAEGARKQGLEAIKNSGLSAEDQRLAETKLNASIDNRKEAAQKADTDPKTQVDIFADSISDLGSEMAQVFGNAGQQLDKIIRERQGIYNTFAKNLEAASDAARKARDSFNKAKDIRYNAKMDLREAQTGVKESYDEAKAKFDADIKNLTGGATDPQAIGQNIDNLTAQREQQMKARDAAASDPTLSQEDRDKKAMQFAKDIELTNVALNDNREALDKMANSAELAQKALDEVKNVKGLQQDRENFVNQLLTNTPEEADKLNQSIIRLQRNLAGGLNNPSNQRDAQNAFRDTLRRTGNVREATRAGNTVLADQRKQTLQLMQDPGFRGMMTLNMKNQGMSDKQIDDNFKAKEGMLMQQMAVESGMINNPMVQQALAAKQDPNADPAMKRAADQFLQATGLQAKATEEQGRLELANVQSILTTATDDLRASIETLNQTISNSVAGGGGDKVAGVVPGGDKVAINAKAAPLGAMPAMYASAGRLVDFKPKGTDTVPAMLTPGEFVVNAKATAQHLPMLKAINSGVSSATPARMRKGGVVYLKEGGKPEEVVIPDPQPVEPVVTASYEPSGGSHQKTGLTRGTDVPNPPGGMDQYDEWEFDRDVDTNIRERDEMREGGESITRMMQFGYDISAGQETVRDRDRRVMKPGFNQEYVDDDNRMDTGLSQQDWRMAQAQGGVSLPAQTEAAARAAEATPQQIANSGPTTTVPLTPVAAGYANNMNIPTKPDSATESIEMFPVSTAPRVPVSISEQISGKPPTQQAIEDAGEINAYQRRLWSEIYGDSSSVSKPTKGPMDLQNDLQNAAVNAQSNQTSGTNADFAAKVQQQQQMVQEMTQGRIDAVRSGNFDVGQGTYAQRTEARRRGMTVEELNRYKQQTKLGKMSDGARGREIARLKDKGVYAEASPLQMQQELLGVMQQAQAQASQIAQSQNMPQAYKEEYDRNLTQQAQAQAQASKEARFEKWPMPKPVNGLGETSSTMPSLSKEDAVAKRAASDQRRYDALMKKKEEIGEDYEFNKYDQEFIDKRNTQAEQVRVNALAEKFKNTPSATELARSGAEAYAQGQKSSEASLERGRATNQKLTELTMSSVKTPEQIKAEVAKEQTDKIVRDQTIADNAAANKKEMKDSYNKNMAEGMAKYKSPTDPGVSSNPDLVLAEWEATGGRQAYMDAQNKKQELKATIATSDPALRENRVKAQKELEELNKSGPKVPDAVRNVVESQLNDEWKTKADASKNGKGESPGLPWAYRSQNFDSALAEKTSGAVAKLDPAKLEADGWSAADRSQASGIAAIDQQRQVLEKDKARTQAWIAENEKDIANRSTVEKLGGELTTLFNPKTWFAGGELTQDGANKKVLEDRVAAADTRLKSLSESGISSASSDDLSKLTAPAQQAASAAAARVASMEKARVYDRTPELQAAREELNASNEALAKAQSEAPAIARNNQLDAKFGKLSVQNNTSEKLAANQQLGEKQFDAAEENLVTTAVIAAGAVTGGSGAVGLRGAMALAAAEGAGAEAARTGYRSYKGREDRTVGQIVTDVATEAAIGAITAGVATGVATGVAKGGSKLLSKTGDKVADVPVTTAAQARKTAQKLDSAPTPPKDMSKLSNGSGPKFNTDEKAALGLFNNADEVTEAANKKFGKAYSEATDVSARRDLQRTTKEWKDKALKNSGLQRKQRSVRDQMKLIAREEDSIFAPATDFRKLDPNNIDLNKADNIINAQKTRDATITYRQKKKQAALKQARTQSKGTEYKSSTRDRGSLKIGQGFDDNLPIGSEIDIPGLDLGPSPAQIRENAATQAAKDAIASGKVKVPDVPTLDSINQMRASLAKRGSVDNLDDNAIRTIYEDASMRSRKGGYRDTWIKDRLQLEQMKIKRGGDLPEPPSPVSITTRQSAVLKSVSEGSNKTGNYLSVEDDLRFSAMSDPEKLKRLLNQPNYSMARGLNAGGIVYANNGALIDARPHGTDTVPAMLTPGEFVVNRNQAQKHAPLLNAINSGSYSHGGLVNYMANGGLVIPHYLKEGSKALVPSPAPAPGGVSSNVGVDVSGLTSLVAGLQKTVNDLGASIPSMSQMAENINSAVGTFVSSGSQVGDIINNAINPIVQGLREVNIPDQITVGGTLDSRHTFNGAEAANQVLSTLGPSMEQQTIQKIGQFAGAINRGIGNIGEGALGAGTNQIMGQIGGKTYG